MKILCKGTIILFMGVMFSACSTRIVNWGKQSFNQGIDVYFDKDIICRYIKSISIYDQATTLAKFDVLWLADEIRTEYTRMHILMLGKGDEQYQGLLRRQLDENKHFITFYVLSQYENPLGNIDSKWHVLLHVNDKEFSPTDIKVVELSPEYKAFLKNYVNRFRVSYRIMFDARDMEDLLLLCESTTSIELIFRSMVKQEVIRWDIDCNQKVIIPVKETCYEKTAVCSRRQKK